MEEFVLEVKNWEGREFSVPLSRTPFSIGRGRENDLVLDEPSVSKHHARIARDLEGLVLSDTGSLNGVYVNAEKERISGRRVLRPRDVIRICGNRLTVGVPNVPALPAGPPGNATIVYMRSRDTWDAVKGMRLSSVGDAPRPGGGEKMEEAMSRILLEESLPRACEAVLGLAERLVAFDRCLIIAFDGSTERSRVLASRVKSGPGIEVAVSRAILGRVAREQEAVVVSSREEVNPTQSFVRSGASSALCVPLISDGRVHGVIYLDRRSHESTELSRRDADAIGPVAGLIALKLASSRLEEERRASERIGRDLELARSIQESLLPRERVERQGFAIEGFASPCYEVGGDYFDVIPRSDGTIVIAIGDVSGKGLSSALYMACVRSSLRAHADAGLGAAEILGRLSKSATETFRPDHFITLFLAVLDPRSGVLSYGNAGHLPPLGIDPRGEMYELESIDPAINLVEWSEYSMRERTLAPGEALLLYTDGIMEAESPAGEQYGLDRLRACLARSAGLPLGDIRKAIFEDVEAFSDRKHPEDDRTIVLVRRELQEATAAIPKPEEHPLGIARKVFEAEIPSRIEERHPVIEGALEALKGAGFAPDPFLDRLAIDEAITNAIVHGNRSRAPKKVTVRAFAGEEAFGIEIGDEGEGFDWSGVVERAKQRSGAALAGPGGRGIPLILESGDDVFFLDQGRRIVISWKRGRTTAGD